MSPICSIDIVKFGKRMADELIVFVLTSKREEALRGTMEEMGIRRRINRYSFGDPTRLLLPLKLSRLEPRLLDEFEQAISLTNQ
jgi:hypothetical protein